MQCGVYNNPGDSQSYAPYLLDVQADMLSSLGKPGSWCRSCALRNSGGARGRSLHPVFTVCGEEVVMATHLLAAIRCSGLGHAVDALTLHRTLIIGALDVLLYGV